MIIHTCVNMKNTCIGQHIWSIQLTVKCTEGANIMAVFTNLRRNCIVILVLVGILFIFIIKKQALISITIQFDKPISYGLDFQSNYKAGNAVRRRLSISEQDPEYSECKYHDVPLQNIAELSSLNYGIIMMETSGELYLFIYLIMMQEIFEELQLLGRGKLNSRQACAVESAALRSGLPVHMIIFSPVLHLRDNTTCQLYQSKYPIKFYTIDVEKFTQNTPLG